MTKKKLIFIVQDNLKTLIWALLIAILIRSLIVQPFYIPSSSMEPTLSAIEYLFPSYMDIASILFLLVQIYLIIATFQKTSAGRLSGF